MGNPEADFSSGQNDHQSSYDHHHHETPTQPEFTTQDSGMDYLASNNQELHQTNHFMDQSGTDQQQQQNFLSQQPQPQPQQQLPLQQQQLPAQPQQQFPMRQQGQQQQQTPFYAARSPHVPQANQIYVTNQPVVQYPPPQNQQVINNPMYATASMAPQQIPVQPTSGNYPVKVMPQAYSPHNQVFAQNGNYQAPPQQSQVATYPPQNVPQGYPVPPSPHKPMAQINNMGANIEPWRTGLFDCFDDPMNAVITCLVPCVTFGQVAEIVESGNTSCATSGMLYGLVGACIGLPCIMSCGYRTKLRAKYGLVESPAPDWITHFLCEPCALCQEYRELQHRGLDPTIGWQGNIAKQNMQAQVAMMPPTNQTMMG